MAEHQGPRRHAACQIVVNGDDVTSILFPYLISVQVIDNLEGGMDEAHIELDDRNAELAIPPDGAELMVNLGWSGSGPNLPDLGRQSPAGGQGVIERTIQESIQEAKFGGPGMLNVFDGWVTNVESGFGRRGGGRRLWIEAKGHNDKGKGKEIQKGHMGEGKQDDSDKGGEKGKIPLKDMMTKVFGAAGLSVAMSPDMQKISRDYWNWNDSPMNLGKRLAEETGGLFKISKRTAILIGKIEGVNADGVQMPTVDAIWGINLIGWRIKPYVSRPQYGKTQSRHFDLDEGLWKDVKGAIGATTPHGGTNAIAHAVNSVADKATGEQTNTGAKNEATSQRGTGWVLINGEPNAKANGYCRIEGARPGIDGVYTMTEVEHNYTRGVGYTTRMNVKQPRYAKGSFKWVQNDANLPLLEPGDPGFIGPMPWPIAPEKENRFDWDQLFEIDRLREKAQQPRQDNLIPITREELGEGVPVPPGYVLVGPPPPPDIAPGVSPPISGEQTFTARELELIRQGKEEEMQKQRAAEAEYKAEVDALKSEVDDYLGQLQDTTDPTEQNQIKEEINDALGRLKERQASPP
jgi:Bacteriophage probable baseplate hub protein